MKQLKLITILSILVILVAFISCGSNVKIKSTEELKTLVDQEISATGLTLSNELTTVKSSIKSYQDYVDNEEMINAFYQKIIEEGTLLSAKLSELNLEYTNTILNSKKSNEEKADEVYGPVQQILLYDYSEVISEKIEDPILYDFYDYINNEIYENAMDTIDGDDLDSFYTGYNTLWTTYSDGFGLIFTGYEALISDFWDNLANDYYNKEGKSAKELVKNFKTLLQPTLMLLK